MSPKKKCHLKLRSSHWILNEDNEIILGRGRMKILENIEKTGSINQAAKKMKMSYKGVWSKIKATEKHFGKKIVIADKKTGTQLTETGKTLLEKYRRMHRACCNSDDEIFSRFFE